MTEAGEKQIIDLLTTINTRLAQIEADSTWLREREETKAATLARMVARRSNAD